MRVVITTDQSRIDCNAVHAFLTEQAPWSRGIALATVTRAMQHSLCFAALEHDGPGAALIGFARVVTDRATFAWLCDVFVVESHRGHGLSRRMLEELERHPALQTLRRWCLATRDAHGLYEKFGYRAVPADRWMEKQGPKDRWQAMA
jgi:GNAT superfamily N-acetyltransferase